jgi:uncharacterized protein YfaQ (DUF2300 family)
MKRPLKYLIIAALLGVFVASTTGAQERKMYSWTDENGTVHFSETQPDGQDVQQQSVPQAGHQANDNPYADVDSGPSYAEQKREEIARKGEEAQVNKAMSNAQCAAWQAELDRLEPNRRVFYTNDQGETERMDDVERTNKVAELKSQIARSCK